MKNKTCNVLKTKRKEGLRKLFFRAHLVTIILLLTSYSQAQTINYYDNVVQSGNALDFQNTVDGDMNTFSTLEANAGVIFGIGAFESFIDIESNTPIPANTTTYIRIETEDPILGALLGGTLGDVLSTVLGFVITGQQEFTVKVFGTNGDDVLNVNSANPVQFGTDYIRVVRDVNNHYYLVITPSQEYKKIRITNTNAAIIGAGNIKRMKVWDPYTVDAPSICNAPKFTSFDGGGLDLNLLNIGGANGNYHLAFDNNEETFSTLSTGLLTVGASIRQTIYFEGPSEPQDAVNVSFGINQNMITVNLGSWTKIKTYNGSTVVTNQNITEILSPAQINDFVAGRKVTATIVPGATFDRVVIEVNAIINVNVNRRLQIYEVWKSPALPVVDQGLSNTANFCPGSTTTIYGTTLNPNHEIRWYANDTTTVLAGTTNSNSPFTTGIINRDTTIYFASAIPGCPYESARVQLNLTPINSVANSSITTNAQAQYCMVDTIAIVANSTFGNQFQWYLDADSSDPVANGEIVTDATFTVNNDTLKITGLQAQTSPFNVYVNVLDTISGCWGIAGNYKQISFTINDEQAPSTLNNTQQFCAIDKPNLTDISITGELIKWYDSANSTVVLSDETLLENGKVYYASSTGTICESSVRLPITIEIKDELKPTSEHASQFFCTLDSANVTNLSVEQNNINWYNELGTFLDSTTLLQSGIYYARLVGTQCESSDSLQITVTVGDLPTPTTNAQVQQFCAASQPTLADISVNEHPIRFLDIDGNILPANTLIEDNATYYLALVTENCESPNKLTINTQFINQTDVNLTGLTTNICTLDTILYTLPGQQNNYSWIVNGGTIVGGGTTTDSFALVNWNQPTNPSLTVGYDLASGCTIANAEPITITVIPCELLTLTKTVNNLDPMIGQEIIFTVTATNGTNSVLSNIVIDEVLQSGFQYTSHVTSDGDYNPSTGEWTIATLGSHSQAVLNIHVKVNETGEYFNIASINSVGDSIYPPSIPGSSTSPEVVLTPTNLHVYENISPNDDGVNDYLIIDHIEKFPTNELHIYNRYGVEVYSVKGYQNDWNGYSNKTGVVGKGEKLPIGTYFYTLKIEDINFEKAGWIYIIH